MKRMLSILLCLTLLTGVSGFPAAAADSLNVDSYYTLPESVTVDGVTITADGQIVVSDEKLLQVLGDINASTSDYGTALSVMNGSTVDIGGSVIGNINPDTYVTAIEAGSWSSEDMRPSYVRVGKNVQGNVSAFGSEVDIGGSVTGKVEAYAKSVISVGKDIIGDLYAELSRVDVKGRVEGGIEASGEGTSVTVGEGVKYGSYELPYYASDSAGSPINHTVVHIIASDSAVDANNHATVSVKGDVVRNPTPYKDGYVYHAYGVTAHNGAAVTVDGNVSAINSDGSLGIAIQAIVIPYPWIEDEVLEGSTVAVTGDVKGRIEVNGGSTVDVKGHAEGGVSAWGKGTRVTIGDGVSKSMSDSMSVYYTSDTIDVFDHARVDVIGDVDGSIHTSHGSMVDVSGDARRISIGYSSLFTSDPSDDNDLGSTVRVGKDVANGVFVSLNADGTDQSKVTVEGTISSQGDAIVLNVHPHVVMDIPQPTYPMSGNYADDEAYQKAMEEYQQAQTEYNARQRELLQEARNEMNTAEGVQTIIDNLPQIIVGTLAPEADFVLVNGMMNQDNRKQVTEALLSQINYIVNMEGVDTANIAVYGYEELDGYLVAREQQKLTVKCINDNMVIANVSAGRYATIDANADGSYAITVQRGGDLNLVVTARPKALPVSMDSDGGTENSGTNSAYDEALWSGWLPNLKADYAMRTLTLDLTEVLTTDIPYETLRAYMADYGIDTLIVITENAEYTMSIAEVLALAEDGSTFTFTAHEGALELAVNGSVVSTFSVE